MGFAIGKTLILPPAGAPGESRASPFRSRTQPATMRRAPSGSHGGSKVAAKKLNPNNLPDAEEMLLFATKGGDVLESTLNAAIYTIALQSKENSVRWFETFIEGGYVGHARALLSFMYNSTYRESIDPSQLLKSCEKAKPSDDLRPVVNLLAYYDLAINPAKFPSWISNLPEQTKLEALKSIFASSHYEPSVLGPATEMLQGLPESEGKQRASSAFWNSYFEYNPERALQTAIGIIAPDELEDPLPLLTGLWYEFDPVGVTAEISRLPTGARRDAAVIELARKAGSKISPEIDELVSSISEPRLQEEAIYFRAK